MNRVTICLLVLLVKKIMGFSNEHQCLFLQAFRQQFHLRCVFFVFEKEYSKSFEWSCNNQMVGRLPINSMLCPRARKQCPFGKRLLVLTEFHLLSKVHLQFCDLDNILMYFIPEKEWTFLLKGVYIPINSLLLLVSPNGIQGYRWSSTFNFASDRPPETFSLGTWHSHQGFNTSPLESAIYKNRINFNGIHLKFGAYERAPQAIIKPSSNDGYTFKGTNVELWNVLSKYMNISSEIVNVGKYKGKRLANNTWTGFIGNIQKGEIDLCTAFVMNKERLEILDYLEVLMHDKFSVFFLHSQVIAHNVESAMFAYIGPLEAKLWLATAFLFFLISVIYTIFEFYHPRSGTLLEIFGNCVFEIWKFFCFKGSTFWLDFYFHEHLLHIISAFFFFIIYSSYSAFIISFLISTHEKFIFNNLDELLEINDFRIQIHNGSALESILENSRDPKFSTFYDKYLKFGGYPDINQGLKNVENISKYGFLIYDTNGVYYFSHRPHKIFKFHFMEQPIYLALPITKFSPYKRYLNYKLLRLKETGVWIRIQREVLDGVKDSDERQTFDPIGLDHLILPLAILFGGHFVAICCFFCEIIIFRGKKFKKRKKLRKAVRRIWLNSNYA